MSKSYEKNVYLSMLAEQCSRYEDMSEFLEELLKTRDTDLTSDERNLLSIAYKSTVSSRRTAYRTIIAYENKEKKKDNSTFLPYIMEYKKKIEQELTKICTGIINNIETKLVNRASNAEARVFYHKMKGDYYRYIAEYYQGEDRQKYVDGALSAYDLASQSAKELSKIDPIALGLFLNFSVFHYEIMNDHKNACNIAKETLDAASADLANIDEENDETARDAMSIVNLLRENLEMWKIEAEEENN
jgi:14-3-3 protein epsilon